VSCRAIHTPALAMLLLPGLRAQDLAPSATLQDGRWKAESHDWRWSRLSAPATSWRSRLEDIGLELGGAVDHEWADSAEGVAARCETRLAIDFGRLGGLPHTTAYADATWRHVRDADEHGASNLDAAGEDRVATACIETRLPGDLRVRAGQLDFGSELTMVPERSGFAHAAAAVQPGDPGRAARNGAATGVGIHWAPGAWHLGLAVFEGGAAGGAGSGVCGIIAARRSWSAGGRIEVGGFHADEALRLGGAYAALDQRLFAGGSLLLRAGVGDVTAGGGAVHSACGMTWDGVFGDEGDRCGVLVSRAPDRVGFEAFVEVEVADRVRLRPDLEYESSTRSDGTPADVLTASFGIHFVL
jgi:hypothetical protein